MLDVQMLDAMPQETIFATGVMPDNPEGVNMTNSGKDLRWVAVRGRIADWTIYCHWANEHSIDDVARIGDKVCDEKHIRRCVPCDDEAFARYRY